MLATPGGVASNSRPELATCHGRGGPCHNEYPKKFLLPKENMHVYILHWNISVTEISWNEKHPENLAAYPYHMKKERNNGTRDSAWTVAGGTVEPPSTNMQSTRIAVSAVPRTRAPQIYKTFMKRFISVFVFCLAGTAAAMGSGSGGGGVARLQATRCNKR